MKAGFVQFDPLFGEVHKNIEKAIRLIEPLEADLVVLPEFFNTGYLFTSKQEAEDLAEPIPGGPTTDALCDIARRKNIHLVGGLIEKAGGRIYNAAVLVSPQGYRATYRKIHLFNEENLWFSPGDREFEVHDIGLCKIGMMICFDWQFPEAARSLALKGAQIICHPTNLVLPWCQEAMKTRSLENRVFSITSNRTGTETNGEHSEYFTGGSQILGTKGEILIRMNDNEAALHSVQIDPDLAISKQVTDLNNAFGDRRPSLYFLP